jgi:pyruvate/2-oxoglutarate dehydrogenase complex dihydrolipoamide dehydrogenase (E3) component
MSVDYDLVVIGMSAYAHKLVSHAAQREARVAWVWDQEVSSNHSENLEKHLNFLQIDHILLLLKNKIGDQPQFKRSQIFAKQISPAINNFGHTELLEIMQIKGVDVIIGKCKFQGKSRNDHILEVSETSRSAFSKDLSQRSLSSRAYAIAHDPPIPLRPIFGLDENNYLTANQLLHLQDLPNSIAVLGNDPYACAIAQTLNFLGVHTCLITDSSHILPNVDVAIARTFQAQLEVEGVEIYTATQVTAVSKIDHDRSRIYLNNTTLECDHLLIPSVSRAFDIPRDRHIYPCRNDQDIAQIIQQVLQTSLWRSSAVTPVPEIINVATTPAIAQIGMTEALAKKKYGTLYILESYVENMGLCKIIGDRQGQILGASMYGDRAKLVIEAIAIAIQGKISIQNIAVLKELKINEQWEQLHHDNHQQAKLKDWFTFRRDWNF